ncbi:MAG: putative transposase [Candidatus Izimaplasma bacterium HR2]|nr:MAG: putative transposase [Candidatus Izimaplasma bacterium HR2]
MFILRKNEKYIKLFINTCMRQLKYSYRIYPNKEQEAKLNQFCGAQRFIWNHFLCLEMEQYKLDGTFRFSHKNITSLPKMKNMENLLWLKDIPSTSLQQTLLYLDKALKHSFRKTSSKKGFPKFKKKKYYQGSFSLAMVNDKMIIGSHIKLPKIGKVKIKLHRKLPSDFKSCQVKQKANKWFIVFTVKVNKHKTVNKIQKVIGLDFNSKDIVVNSNDCSTTNPKFFVKSKQRIKKLNRQLSKKQKGSNNYKKQSLKLAQNHVHVANQRKDFLDKLSYDIVSNNDLICLEDLNIKPMQSFNGRMVQDAGWSMLRSMIEYKADLYGKHVSVINQYFPSTKLCSACGTIVNKSLRQRQHNCNCGLCISRDLNAAINIKNEGIKVFINNKVGTTLIYACGDTKGDDKTPSPVSMNQEAHVALANG